MQFCGTRVIIIIIIVVRPTINCVEPIAILHPNYLGRIIHSTIYTTVAAIFYCKLYNRIMKNERPPGLGVKCFDTIYKSQSATNCTVVDRSGCTDTRNYMHIIFNTTYTHIVYVPLLRYTTHERVPRDERCCAFRLSVRRGSSASRFRKKYIIGWPNVTRKHHRFHTHRIIRVSHLTRLLWPAL